MAIVRDTAFLTQACEQDFTPESRIEQRHVELWHCETYKRLRHRHFPVLRVFVVGEGAPTASLPRQLAACCSRSERLPEDGDASGLGKLPPSHRYDKVPPGSVPQRRSADGAALTTL